MSRVDRIVYADFLRIFATFSVIVLHTAGSNWYSTPVNSFNWQIYNIYDSLARWCVPVFVMLSGMFFLDERKNISVSNIYKKYILRILTALVIWGAIYNFYHLYFEIHNSIDFISATNIISIFTKLLFGPPWYHLWFLYLIVGLYILTPLCRVFVQNCQKKDIEYLLIIYCAIGLFIPMLNKVFSLINPAFIINFSIIEINGYIGYFFAGYYFSKYNISNNLKFSIYLLGIISVLITIICTSIYSNTTGKPEEYLYNYLLPTTMFVSYAVFIFSKNNFDFSDKKISKFISYLSSCTFGIYLIHFLILTIFLKYGITVDLFNPVFSVILVSCANFIISAVVIMVLKNISILNKYAL